MSDNPGAGLSENDAPVDESMVIEFSFQIFATALEAAQYASALRLALALAPIFEHVGHYEGPRTALTSTADGQLDETHSASHRRRKPGQSLFDVSIAVRGRRDDREQLGDAVLCAVTDAQLDFEQMTEGYFEGHYLHHGLDTYPTLQSRPRTAQ